MENMRLDVFADGHYRNILLLGILRFGAASMRCGSQLQVYSLGTARILCGGHCKDDTVVRRGGERGWATWHCRWGVLRCCTDILRLGTARRARGTLSGETVLLCIVMLYRLILHTCVGFVVFKFVHNPIFASSLYIPLLNCWNVTESFFQPDSSD